MTETTPRYEKEEKKSKSRRDKSTSRERSKGHKSVSKDRSQLSVSGLSQTIREVNKEEDAEVKDINQDQTPLPVPPVGPQKNRFDELEEMITQQSIKLHGEMSDFMDKVRECKDASANVEEICKTVEAKGNIGIKTIEKLDDKLKQVQDENYKIAKSLEEVIHENKGYCMENNGKTQKKFTETTSQIDEILMWRRTTVAGKFDEIDAYLNKLDKHVKKAQTDILRLFKEKHEEADHLKFNEYVEGKIK